MDLDTLLNIKKTVIYLQKNFIEDTLIIVFSLIGFVASLALKLLTIFILLRK